VDATSWLLDVQRERAWREAHYTGPDTPLAPDARASFKGLRWFPADPAWRLQGLKLWRHKEPLPGRLASTGEEGIVMMEVGAFAFEAKGVPCRLLAYAPAPGETEDDYILVPFRDLTSGKESYGGGRYLDLEPHPEDAYDLDFNRAYHPYCAHDDRWSCVIPPPENKLNVRVEAGERLD
jgi:hypothetical protein